MGKVKLAGKANLAGADPASMRHLVDTQVGERQIGGDMAGETLAQRLTRRTSDTIAYGLLVYTGLQIFVTMRVVGGAGGSLLPMLALVVLVAAIIPMYRHFERDWDITADALAADDIGLREAFRRVQIKVWLTSVGLPFVITGIFRAVTIHL